MPTSIKNAKRSNSIRDTAAERWSRVYVDVRASYGRASIQSALLLNGGASVALLAALAARTAAASHVSAISMKIARSRSVLAVRAQPETARVYRDCWRYGGTASSGRRY
jgi:hypothetical protein